MTEEKKSQIQYLDRQDLELIHRIVSGRLKEDSEPIPPFSSANEKDIDALVKVSQSQFFGFEQYPTLASKAAIVFYTVNKKHLFENGNKRLSVAYLLIFLAINHKSLNISEDELTEKALWLAQTTHEHSFPEIKDELTSWISEHLVDDESSRDLEEQGK